MDQTYTYTQRAVVTTWYPIHALLTQFPVACFTLVLITDLTYWRTSNLMWQNFSSWLLFAGLVFGALAAIDWIFEFLVWRPTNDQRHGLPYAIASLAVLLLAFINSLVHSGDGWTAVVPWGLALSILTVLGMIACYWLAQGKVVATEEIAISELKNNMGDRA